MDDGTLEAGGYSGKIVVVGWTDPQSWIERCKGAMRVFSLEVTDRLERWLSFLSRRWTEPTTRAGEPCTEKRGGYVRGGRREEGGEGGG